MLLERKKKYFRDTNSQLSCYISNLKAFKCALQNIHISCSCRAQVAENQMQNLNLQLAESQCKLNCQPCTMATIKIRALIGKKGFLKGWVRVCEKTLMKLGTLMHHFCPRKQLFCRGALTQPPGSTMDKEKDYQDMICLGRKGDQSLRGERPWSFFSMGFY